MEDVKISVRAILTYLNRSATYKQILSEYRKMEGANMPHPGYSSPIDMLKNMPDVVRIESGPGQIDWLSLVPSERSVHIANLVAGQRKDPHDQKTQKRMAQIRFEPIDVKGEYVRSSRPRPRPTRKEVEDVDGRNLVLSSDYCQNNSEQLLDYIFL